MFDHPRVWLMLRNGVVRLLQIFQPAFDIQRRTKLKCLTDLLANQETLLPKIKQIRSCGLIDHAVSGSVVPNGKSGSRSAPGSVDHLALSFVELCLQLRAQSVLALLVTLS